MTSVIVRRCKSGLKIIIIIIVQTVPQYQNRPGNLVGALTLEASPTCVSLLEMVKSATRDMMKSRELVKSAAVVALEASTRKMTSA